MVALGEKLCRNDTRPQCGRRRRKDRFGRYSKSPAAPATSVISVAGNYPNGGLTGNIPNGTTDSLWQGWQTMEDAIDANRDKLIAEMEKQLRKSHSIQEIFVFQWSLV